MTSRPMPRATAISVRPAADMHPIKRGRFVLGGRPIDVSRNDGPNHLHGGFKGFDRQIWDGEIDQAENSISFSLVSEDGDEGFPGRLVARSKYLPHR